MASIRRIIFALCALPLFLVCCFLGFEWRRAASIISNAEINGVINLNADEPPSIAERVIIFSEFQPTWELSGPICPTLQNLWASAADHDNAPTGATIGAVMAHSFWQEGGSEYGQRKILRQIFVACQLDNKKANIALLRGWLNTAYFGAGDYGIENAAQSIFAKPASQLSEREGARLAILLRFPFLRNKPEIWLEKSEILLEKHLLAEASEFI